jgi:hypothetical protein
LEEEVVKTKKEMEKFKALYLQNIPRIKALVELKNILRKHRSPLLKTGLGYVSGSRSKQTESKELVKMIKFQVNRHSDHVNTLPPKDNKDKMIPDKKTKISEDGATNDKKKAILQVPKFLPWLFFLLL